MACCSTPPAAGKGAGCGCGAQPPFPWLSAIGDPVIRRLFLRRYGWHLLAGTGSGLLAGLAVLALGDRLGAIGPMLGGPWLHLHPATVLPATVLAGLVLSLRDRSLWPSTLGWLLACEILAGGINGGLEVGFSWSGFFLGGGLLSPLAFAVLAAPMGWLAWAILRRCFLAPQAPSGH